MQFDGTDIGGKEVGAASIEVIGSHYFGDPYVGEGRALLGDLKQRMGVNLNSTFDQNSLEHEPHFYVATAYDALMVGALDGSMDIAKAQQTEVTIKYQVSVYVSSIKGVDGSADIDKIRITVVTEATLKPIDEEGDMGVCIGFTVQVTGHKGISLWGREPHLKGERSLPPKPKTLPNGVHLNADHGWVGAIPWFNYWIYYFDLATGDWTGFGPNGFASQKMDAYGYIGLQRLSLEEIEWDTIARPPYSHPRLGILKPGTIPTPDPVMGGYWYGHYFSDESLDANVDFVTDGPFAPDAAGADYGNYGPNVKIIDDILRQPRGLNLPSDHSIENDSLDYIFATTNFLIAAPRPVTHEKGSLDFTFEPQIIEWGGLPGKYYTIALLPPESSFSGVVPPYDYAGDPWFGTWYYATYEGDPDYDGYTFFGHYQNLFLDQTLLGVEMPYAIGGNFGSYPEQFHFYSTEQHVLFPSLYLHPLMTFVDYTASNDWVIKTSRSVGHPDTKAVSGDYAIEVSADSGAAFVLDIELFFGDGTRSKKTQLEGVMGEKNDQLRIAVKKPVEGGLLADDFITIIR